MAHWLLKSEPDVFSIEDLRRKKVAGWDGVRNYQARNNLRAMRKGDRALFYHSSTNPPAVVGMIEVVREAYPDKTAKEPGWVQVDVRYLKTFAKPLTLDEIKRIPPLRSMVLLKHSRLSVQPVTTVEWSALLKIVASFLIVCVLAAGAHAECVYFRVSTDLVKCAAADAKALNDTNPYQPAQDLPEFQDSNAQALVQASCSCGYSLSGSDPRCDMEETVERSSVIGVDDPAAACRRGKALCKDVCPSHLP
jgi:predicted RNA-binding protein with PUA-like domain